MRVCAQLSLRIQMKSPTDRRSLTWPDLTWPSLRWCCWLLCSALSPVRYYYSTSAICCCLLFLLSLLIKYLLGPDRTYHKYFFYPTSYLGDDSKYYIATVLGAIVHSILPIVYWLSCIHFFVTRSSDSWHDFCCPNKCWALVEATKIVI